MGFWQDTARDVRLMKDGWRWGRRPQVPRSAEPFVPAPSQNVYPNDWSRTPAAMAARELVQKVGLAPLFHSQVRVRAEGAGALDRIAGPVIFVANHASHLDTPLILLALPDARRRRTAVAAAADYFFDTWWRAVGSSLVFNTMPIDRRGGTLAATPGEVLDDGWSLLIYPEGTRSHDGWMRSFRMGAAFLAVQHGVPVVPVAHRGTFAAMPRGAGWVARGRPQLTVRFGDPVAPAPEESVRAFAPRVQRALARLLDEERTDWYSSLRRAADDETPDPAGHDDPRAEMWEGPGIVSGRRIRRREPP